MRQNNFAVGADRLQAQMGHASFSTMRQYIAYAERHKSTEYPVQLPSYARAKAQGLKVMGELETHAGGQEADNTQNCTQREERMNSVSA
jgi:hypothetical protein